MYGRFQGGPRLGPHDAERRQSLGQLKSVGDIFPVWQSFYTEKTMFPFPFLLNDSAVMYGGFFGALNWAPLMPSDAILSDS